MTAINRYNLIENDSARVSNESITWLNAFPAGNLSLLWTTTTKKNIVGYPNMGNGVQLFDFVLFFNGKRMWDWRTKSVLQLVDLATPISNWGLPAQANTMKHGINNNSNNGPFICEYWMCGLPTPQSHFECLDFHSQKKKKNKIKEKKMGLDGRSSPESQPDSSWTLRDSSLMYWFRGGRVGGRGFNGLRGPQLSIFLKYRFPLTIDFSVEYRLERCEIVARALPWRPVPSSSLAIWIDIDSSLMLQIVDFD